MSADYDDDDDAVALCVGRSVMCAGLREGRHLMLVAAGMVVIQLTSQLK